MFKKETNINAFLDKPIFLKLTKNEGQLEGAFGKSGKVKAVFKKGVFFT